MKLNFKEVLNIIIFTVKQAFNPKWDLVHVLITEFTCFQYKRPEICEVVIIEKKSLLGSKTCFPVRKIVLRTSLKVTFIRYSTLVQIHFHENKAKIKFFFTLGHINAFFQLFFVYSLSRAIFISHIQNLNFLHII